MPTLDQARAAKDMVREVYSRLADVNGIGVTRIGNGYGIKVNLKQRPSPDILLPNIIGGVPVQVEVIGALRKY